MACCGFGFGTSTEPVPFNAAVGTSGCLTNKQLLVFRAVVAIIFIVHGSWSLIKWIPTEGAYYFMYLTRQSLWLEVVYVVLLVPMTYMSQSSLDKSTVLKAEPELEQGTETTAFPSCCSSNSKTAPSTSVAAVSGNYTPSLKEGQALLPSSQGYPRIDESKSQSCLHNAMVIISQIINPLALAVVILYWTLDNPVWKLCPFNDAEDCKPVPSYLGLFVHGLDWILLTMLFFVGRVPFYLSNALWLTVYMVGFSTWTYLHFVLKIGVVPGSACRDYPLNECPLYEVLDWHHPESTGALVGGIVFIGGPVLCLVYKGLAGLRDGCSKTA